MDYIITNIRLPKEDYMRLKIEAARSRKSFSAVIRERVKVQAKTRSKVAVARIIEELDKLAKENTKKLKGFDSVKALREMRYEGKW